MFAISPALSALHLNVLHLNYIYVIFTQTQMRQILLSSLLMDEAEKLRTIPKWRKSKMWTQEDQVGNYDKTLWRKMWLEDPKSDWPIVCPVHILFYYILFVWLSGSSPSVYTNPGQLPVSTLWWTLCIWKSFLWCQRFSNRHPLDLRKGGKKTNKM